MKNSKKGLALISLILLAAVSVGLTLIAYRPMRDFLLDADSRLALARQIESLGWWAPAAVLGLQIFQMVIAVLPGEPVEVLAGMVCGGWGGLLVCLLGILIGAAAVFFMVRRWGKPLVNVFFSDAQIEKIRFLREEKHLERLVFIAFLIPGTPKDILNYLAGLTKIKPSRFLILSTLARIPSVITSTFAGGALAEGNLAVTLALFALSAALAAAGLHLNSLMGKRAQSERDKPADPRPPDE